MMKYLEWMELFRWKLHDIYFYFFRKVVSVLVRLLVRCEVLYKASLVVDCGSLTVCSCTNTGSAVIMTNLGFLPTFHQKVKSALRCVATGGPGKVSHVSLTVPL